MKLTSVFGTRWLTALLVGVALIAAASFLLAYAAAAPLYVPAAPTGLAAPAASSTHVSLQWVDNSTDEDGFEIERSIDGTNWVLAATLGPNYQGFGNTGLDCDTPYSFRVRSFNGSGYSDYSNVAGATTKACTLPAPTGLTAMVMSQTQIDLNWNDTTSETEYKLQRWPDNSTPPLDTWGTIATLGQNVTNYSNVGLVCSTTYTYQVRAVAGSSASNPSNVVSATTHTCGVPIAPPGAPGNLRATAILQSQIDMAWDDNSANEDGFNIERNPNSGGTPGWGPIGTVGQDVTAYSNTSLTCGNSYSYRVRAYNAGGYSAYSNVLATDTAACTIPAAPTDLTATPFSDTEIDLGWTDNSSDEWGFRIMRSPDGVTFTGVYTTGPDATSHRDSGLACNTPYTYRVGAYNAAGSNFSTDTTATTNPCPTHPPASPIDLRAWTISKTEIGLAWTNPTTDTVNMYKIDRRPYGDSTWTQVATTTGTTTVYTDTGLTCGSAYDYQVTANNTNGDSTPVSISNIPTAACSVPSGDLPPSSVGARASGNAIEISVWWVDNSIQEAGFVVERSEDSWSWLQLPPTGPNHISYQDQDTNLVCGTTYTYQVRACYGTNCSEGVSEPTSNQAWATTLSTLCPPSSLSAAFISETAAEMVTASANDGYVKLTWTDNSADEIQFGIERAELNSSSWVQVAKLGPNTTAFADFGVARDTQYHYRVKAVNQDFTTFSQEITVSTGASGSGRAYLPLIIK